MCDQIRAVIFNIKKIRKFGTIANEQTSHHRLNDVGSFIKNVVTVL